MRRIYDYRGTFEALLRVLYIMEPLSRILYDYRGTSEALLRILYNVIGYSIIKEALHVMRHDETSKET